jgi:KaiC/GvpD/RAD55 family RecA-like ATPase
MQEVPTADTPERLNHRSLLDTITKGRRPRYIWALIYGTDGVGKSTLCSHAPNPIFVGAEKGTEQLDVARFPQTESISELFAQLATLQTEKHEFSNRCARQPGLD